MWRLLECPRYLCEIQGRHNQELTWKCWTSQQVPPVNHKYLEGMAFIHKKPVYNVETKEITEEKDNFQVVIKESSSIQPCWNSDQNVGLCIIRSVLWTVTFLFPWTMNWDCCMKLAYLIFSTLLVGESGAWIRCAPRNKYLYNIDTYCHQLLRRSSLHTTQYVARHLWFEVGWSAPHWRLYSTRVI